MGETIFILQHSKTDILGKELLQARFETLEQFTIHQNTMNGLNELINWLEGFRASKGGTIPGQQELIMHYRDIVFHFNQQRQKR